VKETILDKYLHLRLLIGYLGEAAQFNWWPTSFFQPSSKQFLEPVFARTTRLAQYHGVKEAARRLHDEHIGVGSVFHLFRLPEEMEREIHGRFEDQVGIEKLIGELASKDAALHALSVLADGDRSAGEGPISIGKVSDLRTNKAIKETARCYKAAFNQGAKSYPYFLGET